MSEESTSEKLTLTHSQFERLERDMARCKLMLMPLLHAAGVELQLVDDPPPMTQEEVENWILLKGQNPEERWFEMRILDPVVGEDPTAKALMVALSDMINRGVHDMPFLEAQAKDNKDGKPDLTIVKPGGRSAKGD